MVILFLSSDLPARSQNLLLWKFTWLTVNPRLGSFVEHVHCGRTFSQPLNMYAEKKEDAHHWIHNADFILVLCKDMKGMVQLTCCRCPLLSGLYSSLDPLIIWTKASLQWSTYRYVMLLEMPRVHLSSLQPLLQKSDSEVLCHVCQSHEIVSDTWKGNRHLCLDSWLELQSFSD